MRLVIGLSVSLVLILGTVNLNAQGRGKGNRAQSDDGVQGYATNATVTVSIGQHDQQVIHEWFSRESNLQGLPPGLAKREKLPPGLQRQLVRNGQLPPGLQKKVQPLPSDLEVRLTRLPEGRRRVVINGSIILLDERKNLILDMVAIF